MYIDFTELDVQALHLPLTDIRLLFCFFVLFKFFLLFLPFIFFSVTTRLRNL